MTDDELATVIADGMNDDNKNTIEVPSVDASGNKITVPVTKDEIKKMNLEVYMKLNEKFAADVKALTSKYCPIYGKSTFDKLYEYMKVNNMTLSDVREEIALKKCRLSAMARRTVVDMPEEDLLKMLSFYEPAQYERHEKSNDAHEESVVEIQEPITVLDEVVEHHDVIVGADEVVAVDESVSTTEE